MEALRTIARQRDMLAGTVPQFRWSALENPGAKGHHDYAREADHQPGFSRHGG